jgi:hypothetical protein
LPAKKTDRRRARVRTALAKHLAKTPRDRPSPGMTYLEDRETVYDVPLEVLWDFMKKDEEFHPKAHAMTLRNVEVKELSEVTSLIAYEMQSGGRWRKMVSRLTEIRPAVRIDEELEGPYAGSKKVFLYSPRGKKTSVDVLCYMRSSELSPKEIERLTMKDLADNHAEDEPFLRPFARKHPAGLESRS